MKRYRWIVTALMIGTATLMMDGCQSKTGTPKHLEKKVDKSGYEYTAKYICPMHCKGSGSDTEGQCNICGMDYRVNKEYVED